MIPPKDAFERLMQSNVPKRSDNPLIIEMADAFSGRRVILTMNCSTLIFPAYGSDRDSLLNAVDKLIEWAQEKKCEIDETADPTI